MRVLLVVAVVVVGAFAEERATANSSPTRAAKTRPARMLRTWPTVMRPTAGPPRVIGGAGAACIAGAVPLPFEGEGYQAVDLSRRRYFGHPTLIAFVTDLGKAAAAANLGVVMVGDLAQPRGGPMSSGHMSHQGGLDVDIWFRLDLPLLPRPQREGIDQPPVLDPATGRPDPRKWGQRNAELVRAAAMDPRVSRVFVGAAIKRDLCERIWPDRSWLRLVRPWPRHDEHLHVRLRCPPDSPACRDQAPLPESEGCSNAELLPAIARDRALDRVPPPPPNRNVPAACGAVLASKDQAPELPLP